MKKQGSLNNLYEIREELIDGKTVMMSPSPGINHNFAASRIFSIFDTYLEGKKCVPFADGTDLYLSEGNRFIPDCMIVCDTDKLKDSGVYGAPDLVVEVLSPNTSRNDFGRKMDAYEKAGVLEYWIVSPSAKQIDVYLLEDGRFSLDNTYRLYSEQQLARMTEEDRAEVKNEFKCSLFDDLSFSLKRIFERVR